jgi:hypothetical protein
MLQAVEESLLLCCTFNLFFYSVLQPKKRFYTVEEFSENLLFLSCCNSGFCFIAGLALLYTYNEILDEKKFAGFLKIQLNFY